MLIRMEVLLKVVAVLRAKRHATRCGGFASSASLMVTPFSLQSRNFDVSSMI